MERLENVVLDWLQASGRPEAEAVTGLSPRAGPFRLAVSWVVADGSVRDDEVSDGEMVSLWRHLVLAWRVESQLPGPRETGPFDAPYISMAQLNAAGQAMLGEQRPGMTTLPAGGGDRDYGREKDGVALPEDW